jgi:hypothetical protein
MKPSAPKMEARTSDSLSLTIEIPPDFNGEHRIQFYEAGYMYNSSWQTKEIPPESAETVPSVAGWDSDGKPMFTNKAVYRLSPLQPNKCYVVRNGLRIDEGKWLNSAKSDCELVVVLFCSLCFVLCALSIVLVFWFSPSSFVLSPLCVCVCWSLLLRSYHL